MEENERVGQLDLTKVAQKVFEKASLMVETKADLSGLQLVCLMDA